MTVHEWGTSQSVLAAPQELHGSLEFIRSKHQRDRYEPPTLLGYIEYEHATLSSGARLTEPGGLNC